MKNLLAQIQIAPSGGFKGLGSGSLADPNSGIGGAVGVFSKFISGTIGIMTIVAIIWAIFTIITGAISIISSGGDKQALETARKKITTGIIGLVVVIIALFIIQIIGYLLGITDILNVQCLVNLVSGGNCAGQSSIVPPNGYDY